MNAPRSIRATTVSKRPVRVATLERATLIDSDGGRVEVLVTDISGYGFRLEAGETLVVGEQVRLQFQRHGEVKAEIRWALGTEAGGRFLEPCPLLT